MINWTENKTTMTMTPLIIPEPTTDSDHGQCLAPHILPGTQLSQASESKGSKMNVRGGDYLHSINFKLL